MKTRSKSLQEAITRYKEVTTGLNKLETEKKTLRSILLGALEGKSSISTDNLIVFVNDRQRTTLNKDLLSQAFPDMHKFEIITTSKVLSVKKI